jgi:hypothetical protein
MRRDHWSGQRSPAAQQPTIRFLLDQSGLFQQANHLGPDDLIEKFLSNELPLSQTGPPSFRQLSEPMHL